VKQFEKGFRAGALACEKKMRKLGADPKILTNIAGERAPNPTFIGHWQPPTYSQLKGSQELVQLRACQVALVGPISDIEGNIQRFIDSLWKAK